MNEIEDRIAKAIANAWHGEDCWDVLTEEAFDLFLKAARAAVAVIQPPQVAPREGGIIARAGKALSEADVNTDTFHHYYAYWPEQYDQIVRVVIQEMRNPSVAMMEAMAGSPDSGDWHEALFRYQRAIDAALKP